MLAISLMTTDGGKPPPPRQPKWYGGGRGGDGESGEGFGDQPRHPDRMPAIVRGLLWALVLLVVLAVSIPGTGTGGAAEIRVRPLYVEGPLPGDRHLGWAPGQPYDPVWQTGPAYGVGAARLPVVEPGTAAALPRRP